MSYLKSSVTGPNPPDDENFEAETQQPIEQMSDEQFAALADSILVVIPHRRDEGIRWGTCQHFGMWGRIGLRVAGIEDPNGGFLEITRQSCINMFLDIAKTFPQLHFLVTIDNDQIIPWDAPLRLARHDQPIVSGVVCSHSPERGIFACFTAEDENGVARFPSWNDTKTIPSKGLVKAHQVGTGLLCIRRDVIETMMDQDDWPFAMDDHSRRESFKQGDLLKGEDICFAERAAKYGFDRYVDFGVHAGHYREIPLSWPVEQISNDVEAIDWKVSKFDYRGG